MSDSTRVWDPMVRLFHWSLVIAFAIAWLMADEWRDVHEWSGYVVAGLICFRLFWGFFGSRFARFSHFVRGPGATLGYLNDIRRGTEARHLGHNPAGAAMILLLLLTLAGTALTGWLSTTDRFWGDPTMKMIHEYLANGVLGLVALHVAGVVLASLRHRENLVAAMLSGRKRGQGDSDIA